MLSSLPHVKLRVVNAEAEDAYKHIRKCLVRRTWLDCVLGEVTQRMRSAAPSSQGETIRLRRKEGLTDYRFFPEPDLPPLIIEDTHVHAIEATLPELPEATMLRLSRDHGLSEQLSRLIVCAAGGASGRRRVLHM